MLWFIIALIGYALLAVVFVMDKYILTGSVEKPVVYTFYSTIFMFGALLLLPFGGGTLFGIDWLWAVVSGLGFGFGLWAMFTALKDGETSHISPFVGAVITVSTYGISFLALGERLSPLQVSGMIVLVISGGLLSLNLEKAGTTTKRAFMWAVLAGLLFAVSHVTAKYIYELYPFITGFTWTRATTGLVGLVALFAPSVRATFPWNKSQKKGVKEEYKIKSHNFSHQHAVPIVITDKVLGVIGVVLIQFAISIGSVTLVNAMAGVQYVLMFILILLLTKFAPRVFKEVFTRREVVVQVVALFLVVVGSAMFVL